MRKQKILLVMLIKDVGHPTFKRAKLFKEYLSNNLDYLFFAPSHLFTILKKEFKNSKIYLFKQHLNNLRGISYLLSLWDIGFFNYITNFDKIIKVFSKYETIVISVPPFWIMDLFYFISQNKRIILDLRDPAIFNPFLKPPISFYIKLKNFFIIKLKKPLLITTSPAQKKEIEFLGLKKNLLGCFYNHPLKEEIMIFNKIATTRREEKKKKDVIKIGYFGSIYGARRDSFNFFLNNLSLILTAINSLFEKKIKKFRLDIYTSQLKQNHTIKEGYFEFLITYNKKINNFKKLIGIMNNYDYFLLLQNFDEVIQLPRKLFEYILFSKPIIYVGGNGAINQLLDKAKIPYIWINRLPNDKKEIKYFWFASSTNNIIKDLRKENKRIILNVIK